MQILSGIEGLRALPPRGILSVGNYDGVHLGHRRLLERAVELRANKEGSCVGVVTFEPHPLTRLLPAAAPPRLTTRDQRRRLLDRYGVDFLVELPPDREVLSLRAENFWLLLASEVRAAHLVEGEDFTFGQGAAGNIDRLRDWSHNSPLHLHVMSEVQAVLTNLHVVNVHSNLLRWLIMQGRVRDAAICLGHPYEIEGRIVEGFKRGRSIGVPTANFETGDLVVPADGVYAGRCEVDGRSYAAAVSVGTMPTFGENQRQVEAHLIGYDGDLYGRTLSLEVLDWLRGQEKYPTVELLKEQMQRDAREAVVRATMDPARPMCMAKRERVESKEEEL